MPRRAGALTKYSRQVAIAHDSNSAAFVDDKFTEQHNTLLSLRQTKLDFRSIPDSFFAGSEMLLSFISKLRGERVDE